MDWAASNGEATESEGKHSEIAIREDGHREDRDGSDGSVMTVDDLMGALMRTAEAAEAANSHAHEYPPRCVDAPCSGVQQLQLGWVQEAVGALVAE